MHNPSFLEGNKFLAQIFTIADIIVVDITVNHSTLLKRLIVRNEERDAWEIAKWDAYVKQVTDAKIAWSPDGFTHLTYDNSDALPILQEIKRKNLLEHV